MVKFKAGQLIGFGLSEKNIKLLKQGKPIKIDLTTLGLPGKEVKDVLIFYGKTENDMQKDMADLIGPNTLFRSSELN